MRHYYEGNTYLMPESAVPVLHATSHMQEMLGPKEFARTFANLVASIDRSGLKPSSFAIAGTSGSLLGGALSLHYKKPLFVVHQTATKTTPAGVQGYYNVPDYVIVDDLMFSRKTAENIESAMRTQFPECKLKGLFLYLEEENSLGKSTTLHGVKYPVHQTFIPPKPVPELGL